MHNGDTHLCTTGVGPGWRAAYICDLENGRFQLLGSLTSQPASKAKQAKQSKVHRAPFGAENQCFEAQLPVDGDQGAHIAGMDRVCTPNTLVAGGLPGLLRWRVMLGFL